MKKFLTWIGGIFLLIVALFIFLFIGKGEYDIESKKYVERVTPIILSDLKKETLLIYSSKELKEAMNNDENTDKLFKWFEKLGEFKDINGSEGAANITYSQENGKIISANYYVKSNFETGEALVTVGVIKREGKWLIYNFRINSKALIK